MAEAIPIPSGIEIKLDHPRRLKYSWNSLCEFERQMGMAVGEALGDEKNLGCNTLRALLWAGLIWESPTLTPDEAGDLIDLAPHAEGDAGIESRATYVMARVMLAFNASQGQAKKKEPVKKAG